MMSQCYEVKKLVSSSFSWCYRSRKYIRKPSSM